MANFTLVYDSELKKSKWLGFPDSNYSFEGDRLSYERMVKDENDKDITVKTYKDPIEIIADFQPASEILLASDEIEIAVTRKFGSMKGFVWLDKVVGGGEVLLPFTAPHIFRATGDRLNPTLTEIGTNPADDNYYEIIDSKTHVHVKSFSGLGGAAGSPPTLIAHYKMNENTASDNDELVTNGVAPADLTGWTQQPSTQWSIVGNKFQGAGNSAFNYLTQDFGAVVGRKYKFSYDVTDNSLVGGTTATQLLLSSAGSFGSTILSSAVGTHEYYLTATNEAPANNDLRMALSANATGGTIDLDNISIQLLAVEDSSGNDHDGLAQQDTDAISVAGQINTAFDFTPNDYILIPDDDDFTPALTPFSISAWVYMHDATNFVIASKGVYNTDGEWRFQTSGTDILLIRFHDESVADCYIGRSYATALTAYENQWVHLVVTYDGGILSSGIKLYLNSVKIDNQNNQLNQGSFVSVENLTHDVWIGRYSTSYANGVIDNVMFFSVELNQDNVNDLYNGGHGTENLADLDESRRNVRR